MHQSRVLQRDAQAARQRRQQTYVVLREGVRAVEVLERDPAAHFVSRDERCEQGRQRGLALHYREGFLTLAFRGRYVIGQDRSLRLEHPSRRRRVLDGGGLVGDRKSVV